MLQLLIIGSLLATLACIFLIRSGRQLARRYAVDMPQRFHVGHVPRLGGAAMLLGCLGGWLWMVVGESVFDLRAGLAFEPRAALITVAVTALAVAPGLAEDITHRVTPRWRLGASLLAGFVAAALLGLQINRIDVTWLDAVWTSVPLLSVALVVVAIAGLPHAFNLIDGYNGLASSVAILCCLALAYVALQVGDRQLAGIILALAGATAGFLVWNYPRGLIFAGDGGAYLWGVVIAIVSIQLVQRHPQVSPWFPMLLLIYPVWETLFSTYRKLARGQSPGLADALHFHQLIYRRIVRGVFHDDEARRMLMRNNRTSPYLWGFTLLTVIPAMLFWQNTAVLMAFCALFVVTYVYAYLTIVRFKVPRWMRRGRAPSPNLQHPK